MTIEKRPNATADKNAPTQAPVPVAPPAVPGPGPKLPGAPGVRPTTPSQGSTYRPAQNSGSSRSYRRPTGSWRINR